MKNQLSGILICTLFFSCGSNSCVEGTGNIISETRTAFPFNALDNQKIADIIFDTTLDDTELLINGEDNILEIIVTTISANRLLVENERNCTMSTEPVIITTNPSGLTEIENSGTGDISGIIPAQEFDIDNSGTGNIALSTNGAVNVDIVNSGTGDISLEEDPITDATIINSGTGDVYVNVTGNLTVTISGIGDVYYKGNPVIISELTGIGELIDNN